MLGKTIDWSAIRGGWGRDPMFFNGKSHEKVSCIFSIKCCTELIDVVRCKSQITKVKNHRQRRWDHYRGRWPASCRQMHNAQLARTWTKDQNINHEIHCVIVFGCQKPDLEFWPKFKSEDQFVLSMFPNYDGFDTCRPVWYWRCRWSPCIHWCLLLLVEFVNNFQSAVIQRPNVDAVGWHFWNKSITKATVLRLWSTAIPRTGLMRGSIRMIEIQLNWPPKHIYHIYVKAFRD